ncbi:MAG: hypothetical protein WBA74_18825 [Cyclobacteriaceae bacterium]
MKKISILIFVVFLGYNTHAQDWNGLSSTNDIWRKGSVGVGVTPSSINTFTVFNNIATLGDGNYLKFQQSNASTNYFGIRHHQSNRLEIGYDAGSGFTSTINMRYTGHVGIGIVPQFNDVSKLSVGGNASLIGDGNFLFFKATTTTPLQFAIKHTHNNNLSFGFDSGSGFQNYMMIRNNGKIGIGLAPFFSTDALFSVDGLIASEEIVVRDVTGADFVFDTDYDLRSLEEIEAFVKENKHLPEIAPAKVMHEEGLELGEMNIKLLQKVEELTLYLIEQNKKIEALQQEVSNLKND